MFIKIFIDFVWRNQTISSKLTMSRNEHEILKGVYMLVLSQHGLNYPSEFYQRYF